MTIIAALIFVVFVLTRILHYVASIRAPTRIPIYLGSTLLAALSVWVWMNPVLMVRPTKQPDVISFGGSVFDFGAYPVEADLKRIKQSGYTAVISLLHPAVVPFEPRLMSDERKLAAKMGITVIELPMLPWVSKNEMAVDSLKKLAALSGARYYVHCYLGRDRVGVARRILANGGTNRGEVHRASLDTVKRLERGRVEKLMDSVFLAPYPTDDEYFVFIVGGGVKTVVSLMDSAILENREWIAREKEFAVKFGLDFVHVPVPSGTSSRRTKIVAEHILRARKPVVVHDFRDDSPSVEAIRRYFLTAPR